MLWWEMGEVMREVRGEWSVKEFSNMVSRTASQNASQGVEPWGGWAITDGEHIRFDSWQPKMGIWAYSGDRNPKFIYMQFSWTWVYLWGKLSWLDDCTNLLLIKWSVEVERSDQTWGKGGFWIKFSWTSDSLRALSFFLKNKCYYCMAFRLTDGFNLWSINSISRLVQYSRGNGILHRLICRRKSTSVMTADAFWSTNTKTQTFQKKTLESDRQYPVDVGIK